MVHMRSRPLSAAAFVAISVAAFGAHGQQYPTALELAQMPKFCWSQYNVPNATGDEYKILGCGVGMNHYCGGLMQLIRAKGKVNNKNDRMVLLGRAMTDIRYTENAMRDPATCPIRDHVAATKQQILNLQKIWGGEAYGAK